MLCQFILWEFCRIGGGVEVREGCTRRKLFLEHLAEAEATATGELLRERIRQHVTVDVARGSVLAEHRGHRGPEQLTNEDGFKLGGDFLPLFRR